MARFFSEAKIEEFKECFNFHARLDYITREGDLSIIMRSLGYSPTREEIASYYAKYATSDGRIDFAIFLDIMHSHSRVENCQKELLDALMAQDRNHTGYVNAADIRHILTNTGEHLSRNEVDTLFRESGIPTSGQVKITDFVQSVMTPSPDY
ncbi:calmodulin-like protein 4 [Pomacea canaliculata]|uniref:calmodulin-like protein 4 n=1 Tax=Pomacea canaliculata TaxID=400727 RepID=UPI000D72DCD7|nr:calmodulin-like protein 4 [Pomacea canaliculata]